MEQHVSTFLIGHHQAKHVLYNTQKEYKNAFFFLSRIKISISKYRIFRVTLKELVKNNSQNYS